MSGDTQMKRNLHTEDQMLSGHFVFPLLPLKAEYGATHTTNTTIQWAGQTDTANDLTGCLHYKDEHPVKTRPLRNAVFMKISWQYKQNSYLRGKGNKAVIAFNRGEIYQEVSRYFIFLEVGCETRTMKKHWMKITCFKTQ